MAFPPGKSATPHESLIIDDASVTSSTSRTSRSLEDGDTYQTFQPRTTLLGRVLTALGMSARRRKGGYEYEPAPVDELPAGLLKRPSQREVRRCRRGFVLGYVKRIILGLPIAVLLLLYV